MIPAKVDFGHILAISDDCVLVITFADYQKNEGGFRMFPSLEAAIEFRDRRV